MNRDRPLHEFLLRRAVAMAVVFLVILGILELLG
jgi:hypothetical protein